MKILRENLLLWHMPRKLKKIVILTAIIAILLIIHEPVIQFLDSFLTIPILSTVKSNWVNNIIFFIAVLVIILVTLVRVRKYVPSFNYFLLLLGICLLYILTLTIHRPWNYTSLKGFPDIRYADIILLATLCNAILFITSKKYRYQAGFSELLDDSSLGEVDVDELGYDKYAFTIASKILKSQFKNSFAIGINGKWGLGKTSFFDLIKRKLKSKDIIEVDFNPWNSNSSSSIIIDFFDTLHEKLKPYHSSLSRILLKYSSKLVEVNENTITKTIEYSAKVLSGHESISSLYKSINEALGRIDKKLVIYIDDLDRLDTNEIIEVMRLIRNTANFKNSFFIGAYDKQYITEALKDHNSYGHNQFLEKIFQIEITLPRFPRDILRYKLAEKLKRRIDPKFHEEINLSIHGNSTAVPANLGLWLDTMRDVTRLTNSLIINLTGLYGEVSIKDFIQIEAFRLKHQNIYDLLHRKKNEFFSTSSPNSGKDTYFQLAYSADKQKRQTILREYLEQMKEQLNLNIDTIKDIDSYMIGIFSDTPLYSNISKAQLSIVRPENFDRYFAYQLLAGDLSEVEFTGALRLSLDDLKTKITQWIEKGLAYELQKRLIQVRHFDNREQFEKIIKAIFFLANTKSNDQTYSSINGYDGNDLFDKLEDYNGKKAQTYYSESGGAEGLRKFISSVLGSAEDPFIYESDFIRLSMGKLFDPKMFPLSSEELSQISVDYFRQYCSLHDKVTIPLYHLFWKTGSKKYSTSDGHTYNSSEVIPQAAKDLIIDFFKKDINGFIYWSFDLEVFNENLYAVSPSIIKIFDSWDNFEDFLNKQDENKWTYLAEFKEFFSAAKKDGFQNYIPFTFTEIPISNRRSRQ